MSAVVEFLGAVAGNVVATFARQRHSGIRLQHITPFSAESFLRTLSDDLAVRVILAGTSREDIRLLCKKAKFPEARTTGDLALGTEWRNDPRVQEPIVLVAFGEEERLGSFHRFTPVRDHDLYHAICTMALERLCPNQVLRDWWTVLRRAEVRRQISVLRLASYFLALEAQSKRLPEASRKQLHHLGLLPSREFFDRSSPSQLLRNFRLNRQFAARIELLANADRDRLNRNVEAAEGELREHFQQTLGKVLAYHRTGDDTERGALLLEDVRQLFESRQAPAPRAPRSLSTETVAVATVLDGDAEDVRTLGERVREKLASLGEEESPRVTIDLPSRSEQVVMTVPPALPALLGQSVTAEQFGGIFRSDMEGPLDRILFNLSKATFDPFPLRGEQTFDGKLRRIVESGEVEPEVLQAWDRCVKARGTLAKDVLAIAVSPLVALSSSDALLRAGTEYLDAYQDVLACLRDRYESLSHRFSTGTRRLCALLLLHDTVLFQLKSGVQAVLSPLHPLHLWKFVRLCEQIRRERDTLTPEFRQILAEQTEKLPHFVTALFIPEGFVSDHPLVLPENWQLGTLPCYQQDNPHFSGSEGQDRLLKIIQKFLALYPHARGTLRLCLIDPPALGDLIEALAGGVVSADLPVEGLEVRAYRTLPRPLALGGDEQQLEAIADVFAEEHRQSFHLAVDATLTTYADIIAHLRRSPCHIVAAFDPSRSQVNQFTGHSAGFIHPLVLPKQFQYDPLEDELTITPAATGDIFDLYYQLQNRLNNSLTGSHYGISTSLGQSFPSPEEFLRHCTWLVIGDRLLDTHPLKAGHIISFEPGNRRDIIVITNSFTKFEREFDYHLRIKLNFDPTEEAIRELITASADLVGEGLLGVVRLSGE
jgi:hypothetical protein